MLSDDYLDIPPFLDCKRPEVAKGRAEARVKPISLPPVEAEAKRQREADVEEFLRLDAERRKVLAANQRIAKEALKKAKAVDITNKRWDATRARWVPDRLMVRPVKPKEVVIVSTEYKTTTSTKTTPPPAVPHGEAKAKHDTLMGLLTRPEGATKAEISSATGWLPHTAGARISGIKVTHNVTRTREARGTVYRVVSKKPTSE